MILAAIDVGSNALRMLVGEVTAGGEVAPVVKSIREPIRLGNDVFRSGEIGEESALRVVEAFRRFRAEAGRLGAVEIRAVGTSALREARNRDEIVRRVAEASGVAIETISGEEEARLVFTAVSSRLDLRGRCAMLIDIGGGSVEISLVDDGALLASESAKLGTVRLLEICSGAGAEEIGRTVREHSASLRERVRRDLEGRTLNFCVGTGGNLEALGALRMELLGIPDPGEVGFSELGVILDSLESMDLAARVDRFGIRPDRADVIVPACVLLRELMHDVKAERLLLPGVGLKEGVLLELWRGLSGSSGR